MADDIDDQIETNAKAPRRVSVDGMTTEEHPLTDQIEADRYLTGKTAVDATNSRGLRFSKLKPPGAA